MVMPSRSWTVRTTFADTRVVCYTWMVATPLRKSLRYGGFPRERVHPSFLFRFAEGFRGGRRVMIFRGSWEESIDSVAEVLPGLLALCSIILSPDRARRMTFR